MTATAAAAPGQVQTSPIFVGVALGLVYVVWGSTYLSIRIMVEEMPPLVGAGVRFLTAGVLVAGVLVARGGLRRLEVTGRQLLGCALIGLLLPVLGQGMVTVSVAHSGTLAVIVLAGLSWAFGSWYQARLRLPRDPFVVVVYEMLIGGGVLTILGLATGEGLDPTMYSARAWAAWTYLVLFGSVVAFSAYVWLLQSAAVSLVATYAYVNPLVAVLLGWLILAEPVTIPTIVGGATVVLAVGVVVGAELPTQAPRLARPGSWSRRLHSTRT